MLFSTPSESLLKTLHYPEEAGRGKWGLPGAVENVTESTHPVRLSPAHTPPTKTPAAFPEVPTFLAKGTGPGYSGQLPMMGLFSLSVLF